MLNEPPFMGVIVGPILSAMSCKALPQKVSLPVVLIGFARPVIVMLHRKKSEVEN